MPVLHQLVIDLFYTRARRLAVARTTGVGDDELHMHQEVLTSMLVKYVHLPAVKSSVRFVNIRSMCAQAADLLTLVIWYYRSIDSTAMQQDRQWYELSTQLARRVLAGGDGAEVSGNYYTMIIMFVQLQIDVFAHVRTYARLCVWLEPTAVRAHVQQHSPLLMVAIVLTFARIHFAAGE
jgi:hypothetical protein